MGAYGRLLLLAIPIIVSGVIAGCGNNPGGVGTPGNGAAGAQPQVASSSGSAPTPPAPPPAGPPRGGRRGDPGGR